MSETGPEESPGQLSLFDALIPIVRRWRLTMALPLSVAFLAAVISLIVPSSYTARTTFTTDAASSGLSSGLGGLASLAGQLGVSGLATGAGSPDFYADVLRSRSILEATLMSRFATTDTEDGDSLRTLLDILDVDGDTERERLDNGVRVFESRVSTRVNRRTGVVTLSVEARPATLAADVANRMVALLNDFNLRRLQSQSSEQRRFAGERLQQAERELREAEEAQLAFRKANREYANSPTLAFEEGRLSRRVQLRQEVYLTLTREYEQARIAEVRDTPVLTIIDVATPPERRSAPRRKLIVVIALLLSGMVGIGAAYLAEYESNLVGGRDQGYHAFAAALRQATDEARGALRSRRRANR